MTRAVNTTPRAAMFLGAGASKAFNAPVTSEIFPRIVAQIKEQTLFGGNQYDQKALMRVLSGLMPGIETVEPKYVLVTEILSLIDYVTFIVCTCADGKAWRTAGVSYPSGTSHFEVLTGVVDRTKESAIVPELKRLASWLFNVGKASSLALVSTNYDEIIESELYKCFLCPDNAPRPFDRVNEACQLWNKLARFSDWQDFHLTPKGINIQF